jgi:hypothetical protein
MYKPKLIFLWSGHVSRTCCQELSATAEFNLSVVFQYYEENDTALYALNVSIVGGTLKLPPLYPRKRNP